METGRGKSTLSLWIFSDISLLQCMSVNLCILHRGVSVLQSASLKICFYLRRFSSVLAGVRRYKFLSSQTVQGPLNFFYTMYLSAAQELFILICRKIWGRPRKEKILIHRKTKQPPVKPEGESGTCLMY